MTSDPHQIHIINPFEDLGGSPWRALTLFNMLKEHCDVSLWTEYEPDPRLLEEFPIKRIDLQRLKFPKTGTFVFVGVYFRNGRWVYFTLPRRIILVNNMPASHSFFQRIRKLSIRGLRKVEVVYASELLKQSFNYPGIVEASPVDINRFRPVTAKPSDSAKTEFTIGRLSRDVPEKHHTNDPALYQRLVNYGCRIRIMGGSCLAQELELEKFITLLAVGEQEPHIFLRGLDCFFYRTSDMWLEPFGRVIIEAMACGLPVVCHNRGGYVEVIENGRNGFLFETDTEAIGILLRLKNDPDLCQVIGRNARATVENIFSSERQAEMVAFYSA